MPDFGAATTIDAVKSIGALRSEIIMSRNLPNRGHGCSNTTIGGTDLWPRFSQVQYLYLWCIVPSVRCVILNDLAFFQKQFLSVQMMASRALGPQWVISFDRKLVLSHIHIRKYCLFLLDRCTLYKIQYRGRSWNSNEHFFRWNVCTLYDDLEIPSDKSRSGSVSTKSKFRRRRRQYVRWGSSGSNMWEYGKGTSGLSSFFEFLDLDPAATSFDAFAKSWFGLCSRWWMTFYFLI